MPKILDIGCGNNKVSGAIGIDRIKLEQVDIVHDLDTYPYPFADGEWDEVHAHMVLEHVRDFMAAMEEIYRILKPGGILHVSVPYYNSSNAYHDPTHKNFFTEKTFNYFKADGYLNYYTHARFEILEQELGVTETSSLEKMRNLIPFRNILKFIWFNMYDEIRLKLKKPEITV